jgi:hypothetical protein
MNCFRHPDEIAIVFCRACRHGLCRQCAQQAIRGVTHICSNECARTVRRRPDSEGLFSDALAGVCLIVLLAVLGGALCAWLASSGRIGWELQRSRYSNRRNFFGGFEEGVYKLFHLFGIED